jgi:hypothetical protein
MTWADEISRVSVEFAHGIPRPPFPSSVPNIEDAIDPYETTPPSSGFGDFEDDAITDVQDEPNED